MALWTPAEITIDLWLDAADSDTITLVSGFVSQWADKSGNGRHAVQGSSTARPSVQTDEENGLDVIRFDGSNDLLTAPAEINLQSAQTFIIAKTRGGTVGYIQRRNLSDNTRYYLANVHMVGAATVVSSVTSAWAIHCLRADGTAKAAWCNGSATGTASDSNTFTHSSLPIGGGTNPNPIYARADVGEVLHFYTPLDTETRQRIEGYLAWKWGLEANLPSGHPYELAAPTIFDPSLVPNSQKLKLTLDSTPISADQIDFPLTVVLDGTDPLHAAVFTELGTSSKKLSIQSGTTQLPVEIEHWDATAAKAVLHTKVPTYAAAADGELILSYDNSQVDNDTYVGATGDTLAQSVWDANFAAVYHMAQDPSGTAPQLLDSTANNRRLATAGSMAAADLVDGLLGKSIAFDGIDDKAASAAADYSAVATAATIEALVKWGSVAAGEVVLSIGGAVGALQIAVGSSASYIGNGVIGDMADTAIAPDTASSQHLAHTLSGGTLTAYGNGVADPATNTVTVADLSNTSIIVGARYDGSYAEVIVDEVRISTIARSADWIKLTHLSLTDQLITWSAYGEEVDGVDLAAHLIQRYNLTDPLDTWLDQRYGLAVALSGHLEQPYSFLLQAWLAQYYGDARQLRAHLIQRYGNVPVLRAWLEQLYEDGRPLAVWLEQPWQMSAPLLAHLAQRYGIAAGKLETFVEQLYHLHEHPQLAAILLQPYLIGDLERTTHEFDYEASIGGVPVSPHVVNWDFRRSRYYGTIELTLKEQAEALLAVPGAELAFLFGGTDYRFVIEDGWEETSGWSALSYRVAAHSRTKRLGAPHAAPITGTVGPGLASEVCAALVAPYGITLAYQIADCYLAPIEAEGETPIDLIRRILPEQAVLQSGPAGDVLYVQWDVEVPVPRWFTAPPAATIDDLTGFVQTSETSDPQPGYNRYEIVDQQTAQDNSQLVSEQIDGRTMECRQYLSPWDDALAFDLIHTAGSHVSIEPFGIVTRTETETVEIVDGAGRTRYPIDAVLSTAWRAADLGEVAVADDGIIDAEHKRSWDAAHETYTGGDSLLEISYRTRFWRWLVRSPRIEQVQVVSLRVTEEAA